MMDGHVHLELFPSNQIITTYDYCQTPDKVQQKLLEKGVATKRICFRHDNGRPHTAKLTLAKIEKLDWTKINQPPSSPGIALSDYHLFQSMGHCRKRIAEVDQVNVALADFFSSKPSKNYTDTICSMREKWSGK